TFFAGTYFKNPLIVAAVWACLKHIKNSGPKFYEELNSRTTRLATRLNEYFEQAQVPMRTTHLGSLMRFLYPPEFKLMELFYYHLLAKGIYICETRSCFLSTAHTDEDVDKIVAAVKETIAEMRAGGIIPHPTSDSPKGDGPVKYSIDDPFRNLATSFSASSAAASAETPAAEATEANASVRELPLTEGQKQLWFLARMGGEASVAYNLSLTLEMRGPFNLKAMRESLRAVVDNHEALRITVSLEDDRQYVLPSLKLEVPLIDFSDTDEGDCDARVNALLAQEAKKPFDLAKGPLFRALILEVTEQRHLLVLTTHHIVADGWSLGVLIGELSARYTAACQKVRCALPPAAQFGEYVAAEIKQRESGAIHLSENYWLQQFKDPVAPLELPLDYKRPPVQTYTGARAHLTIDSALCNRLEHYSSQQNSTLFMLLFASFNLLLHKLSGQDDIVVGIPSAGQLSFGSSLIGYCVNVLPLRSKLPAHAGVNDYLAYIKTVFLDAHDHQAYPFSSLVSKLKLPRDPSRSPLVAVMFNLDRAASKPRFFGLEVDLLQNTTDSAQFELDLNITKTSDELLLECDFNTSLFSPRTIERWLGHYRALLVGIVENQSKTVSELSILSESERDQILRAWNETHVDIPTNESFQKLFEQQVERSANAVAAVCGDQILTYAELNERANQLGRQLLKSGAGPEQIVALLAERGIELLVSMLAVFKTAAAYLPLDPHHPSQRIAQVLAESGVSLVLTTRRFSTTIAQVQDKLAGTVAPKHLVFEELTRESEANDNLPSVHSPETLAYVIYTSGSTGVPKGAMVTQKGMLNHLFAKIAELEITERDAIAQNASQCFDISVWQFLSALLVGGRVQIFNDEIAHDASRLLDEVSRAKISILETVPSLLHAIVDSDAWQRLDLNCLRLIVVTGEALPPQVCNRWLDRYPQVPLLNAYGPTECSDDVTHCFIREKLDADVVSVPIGKALANTQLYIVDKFREPAPIGIAGELLVGGDGVGRGYLSRPELTAEKFIPDCFSGQAGARLYRTGDLARYLPDGNIEFLGRMDHQVKVRGHRIELGEIESVLSRHAGVRQAVVLAREDAPGEKRLVAYLVAADGDEVSVTELRRYLKEQLPEYLIPAAYVTLRELPLTANGKVDRRALPAPEQSRPELEREYVAARTPVEEQLCRIWSEVLRVEQVGVYDNFFELGGDSILTIQVVSRARQVGLEITSLDIFQHQTVAELVEVAASHKTTAHESAGDASSTPHHLPIATRETRPSLDQTPIEDSYPLSPTQQGMLFHHLFAPDSRAYFEQISWSLHGDLDVPALRRAWERTIQAHPILRTAFAWEGLDQPLQIVRRRAQFSLAQHDWRELSNAEQATRLALYLQEDRDRGFDLAEPPLRFSLIRMDDETSQFIWSYHHILLDGWAVMLVLKEVFNLYEAYRQGTDVALQPRRPFKNYISWLERQDLSKAEAFWRRTLAGFTAPTPFGVDKSPGGQIAQAEEFAHQEVLLSAQATSSLRSLARQNHLTMSTLVLGAWAMLLSRYSGQDDVVFGAVGSGRPPELEGVEEMVGIFINTLPARVRIDREMSVLEWLKQFQEQQAEARQYEYSPLVQVQGWSDVPRGLPLFESIVAFENYPVNTSLAAQRSSVQSRNVSAVERVNYPLFLVVGPGAGLSITIYFDGRRFDAGTIDRMLGHFQTLLQRMVEDPGQRLAELSPMNELERRRLLFHWNDTSAVYPSETCAHQLFEQQAARTPRAIAMACEGEELTYAELDQKANRLAGVLRTLNVGPESLAGVFMDRSPEMLIALLGVLKAGGAYVPLDPQYPRERIAYMLKDADLRVLLTQQRLRSSLPAEVFVPVVCVDDVDLEGESIQVEDTGVTATNRAYVIYTSGSTGMPKGVEIPHRALVNFLYAMREAIG
ncbi:MAG TPA: amino acid adenylation domain-containing protein, partial [Pyrinomonadaceae bacterium]|nr:amino acid adenylation domain-containing protein [Pyrinomonadaceae bacterium]